MTDRSYSDLSDSATTFDPEEQFDRDIDERMKGMMKEEAVAEAIEGVVLGNAHVIDYARVAIAAADKWEKEERAKICRHSRAHEVGSTGPNAATVWACPDCGKSYDSRKG